jgi:predicted nucleotidyltransferase component of viral defense system
MDEPIALTLKNKSYLNIAKDQDLAIESIFSASNDVVLHDGTAVWRCYGGKRFSTDIDVYVKKPNVLNKILNRLSTAGFQVNKLKLRKGRKTLFYYNLHYNTNIVMEANPSQKKGVLVSYTNVDNSKTGVFTLPSEDLIIEKIKAYNSRRLVKDLYDIYILTQSSAKTEIARKEIKQLLSSIQKPVDYNALKDFVYVGVIPTFEQIIEYLQRWCA